MLAESVYNKNMNNNEAIVLDQPEQIAGAVILSIRSALRMEVERNLKFSNRVNPFKQAKALGLTTATTKRKALDDLNAICAEILGE